MKTICKHDYPSDLCGICNPIAKEKAERPSDAMDCSAAVRSEIQKAIGMIHTDDDYNGGMAILCALAGFKADSPDVTPISLAKISSQNMSIVSKPGEYDAK
jgi:hypothetical protein